MLGWIFKVVGFPYFALKASFGLSTYSLRGGSTITWKVLCSTIPPAEPVTHHSNYYASPASSVLNLGSVPSVNSSHYYLF